MLCRSAPGGDGGAKHCAARLHLCLRDVVSRAAINTRLRWRVLLMLRQDAVLCWMDLSKTAFVSFCVPAPSAQPSKTRSVFGPQIHLLLPGRFHSDDTNAPVPPGVLPPLLLQAALITATVAGPEGIRPVEQSFNLDAVRGPLRDACVTPIWGSNLGGCSKYRVSGVVGVGLATARPRAGNMGL